MQLQINIDDELMTKALEASDLQTAADVIEEGLRMIVYLSERPDLAELLDLFPDIDPPKRH